MLLEARACSTLISKLFGGHMLAGLAWADLPGCAAASYCSDMKLVDIASNTMLSTNRIAIVLCFSI
jgi:hypothetical protein